jgi:hypothetical protein
MKQMDTLFHCKTIHSHLFLLQVLFLQKKETSKNDFSIGCGTQLAKQIAPKIVG